MMDSNSGQVVIKKAKVASNEDATTMSGRFKADIIGVGNGIDITYVSPMHSINQGFVMIPEWGAHILVTKMAGDGAWYYLGTIVSPPDDPGTLEPGSGNEDKPDSREGATIQGGLNGQYDSRGKPGYVVMRGETGEIVISRDTTDNDKKNHYVHMKAKSGKMFACKDSPEQDCILIQNEHGDMIQLNSNTGTGATHSGVRTLDIRSQGDHTYECTKGQTQHIVVDGRDMTLINTSKGFNAAPGDPAWGNINLESTLKEINIIVGTGFSPTARINLFQMAPGGEVQVYSQGTVKVEALGDISLTSKAGMINLNATTGINLNTAGSIEIQSAGMCKIFGSQVGIDAVSTINMAEGIGIGKPPIPAVISPNAHGHPYVPLSLGLPII